MLTKDEKDYIEKWEALPHQYGTEQREAWSFFAIPLYGNKGNRDVADDTEDCIKQSTQWRFMHKSHFKDPLKPRLISYSTKACVRIVHSFFKKQTN